MIAGEASLNQGEDIKH